jgi:hypothetical protein
MRAGGHRLQSSRSEIHGIRIWQTRTIAFDHASGATGFEVAPEAVMNRFSKFDA